MSNIPPEQALEIGDVFIKGIVGAGAIWALWWLLGKFERRKEDR